jgi:hypothetical protein
LENYGRPSTGRATAIQATQSTAEESATAEPAVVIAVQSKDKLEQDKHF